MTRRKSTLWLHPPKRKSFSTKGTPIKRKKKFSKQANMHSTPKSPKATMRWHLVWNCGRWKLYWHCPGWKGNTNRWNFYGRRMLKSYTCIPWLCYNATQTFLLILLYKVCSIFSNGGYDMLVGLPGHQSRLLKDDSGQRWFKLAQLFQRRSNCYKG